MLRRNAIRNIEVRDKINEMKSMTKISDLNELIHISLVNLRRITIQNVEFVILTKFNHLKFEYIMKFFLLRIFVIKIDDNI